MATRKISLKQLAQSGASLDQILKWNGSSWISSAPPAATIAGLSDVDTLTNPPTDGQAMVWNTAVGKWIPGSIESSSGVVSISQSYSFGFFFTSPPLASETLLIHTAAQPFTIPADFANAIVATGTTNPTAPVALDVLNNGVSIGTITISAAGILTAVTVGNVDQAVIKGDRITVVAPSTADATIADWAITFIGIADAGLNANIRPISFQIIGNAPDTDELLLMWTPVLGETVTFPAAFGNSSGIKSPNVGGNPTTPFVMIVKKDAVQVGTITIATNGTVTYAAATETSLIGGTNVLEVYGPTTVDVGVVGYTFTLVGTRG